MAKDLRHEPDVAAEWAGETCHEPWLKAVVILSNTHDPRERTEAYHDLNNGMSRYVPDMLRRYLEKYPECKKEVAKHIRWTIE